MGIHALSPRSFPSSSSYAVWDAACRRAFPQRRKEGTPTLRSGTRPSKIYRCIDAPGEKVLRQYIGYRISTSLVAYTSHIIVYIL
mmetsp:Transcript_1162/g.1822  ORF Transcript_1162/g.1822 Transcript_1162/m.1822 type:complete len:85 (-) Transcript_1162:23-277(-)